MKPLVLLAAFAPLLAHADLYRWVDPASGSVKYSSVAPDWMQGGAGPAVEVVPYRALGVPASPAAPGTDAPVPPKPPASATAPETPARLAALEAEWRGLLRTFQSLPERPDPNRRGAELQQQLQAYESLMADLDRRDPAGSARRRAEEASALERVRKGIAAQFGNRLPQGQK